MADRTCLKDFKILIKGNMLTFLVTTADIEAAECKPPRDWAQRWAHGNLWKLNINVGFSEIAYLLV